MASIWGGRGAEPEDDFDEYDSTPYGGGYDIALTFGRPLSPSDEICHPISSADGGDIDYDRSHYSSGSTTSAYETEADFGDRYGRPRLPQPAYGFHSQQEEEGGGRYGGGRWPQPPRPEYGYGGGEAEYGSGQGFGYGGRQEVEPDYGRRLQEKHGCGYGEDRPKPYAEEGSLGYGYGSKYWGGGQYWKSEEEGYGGGGGYQRTEEYEYGGNPTYEGPSYGGDEEGTGRYQKPSYYGEEQGYGGGGGYRRTEEYEYRGNPTYERPSYGGDEEGTGRYQKPSYYGEEQGEGYGRPEYGNDSDDEEKKHRHHHHHHHHRRNYDDD